MNNKSNTNRKLSNKLSFDILINPGVKKAALRIIILAICFTSLIIVVNLAEWSYRLQLTIMLMLMCFVSIMFYTVRTFKDIYSEVEQLSSYTRNIIRNNLSFEIRDNDEGFISILKNDIHKLAQMLIESRENEFKEKQYLAQSLSEISHQLKTPLNSMGVLVDLLKQDVPNKKKQEFLLSLHMQITRMTWITSALLKIAKLDSNTITFDDKKVYVSEMISKSLSPLNIIIELKNQSVSLIGNEDVFFYGDINWSVEAITNIIKNCVEHTPEHGSIVIEYYKTPLYIEINISDNGKGITLKDLPHIFERFYRGSNSNPDSVGIGLAMSKAIIEKQGGYIKVESEVNKGTNFCIRIYQKFK